MRHYYFTIILFRQITKIKHKRFFGVGSVFGEFYLGYIKQYTPAMTFEGREADHIQIGIDLRTVINDLQLFAVKRCTFVTAKPFGVHIAEQTAE